MVKFVVLKVFHTLNKLLPQVPMNLNEVVRGALDFGKHDHPSLLGRVLLRLPLNCRLPHVTNVDSPYPCNKRLNISLSLV